MKRQNKRVERKTDVHTAIAFIATLFSFVLSVTYLTTNITGYAVANGVEASSFGAGLVFFAIGIFGAVLLLRHR